jgi:hypothetical protein
MNTTGSIQIPYIPQILGNGTEVRKYNAVNHGFWDNRIVITALGERQADFEQLRDAMIRDFNPQGFIEEDLVHRLAETRWLMNRGARFAAAEVTAQVIENNSQFQNALKDLHAERAEMLEMMAADEATMSRIEVLEKADPAVWNENNETSWAETLAGLWSPIDNDISDEFKRAKALQQFRDIINNEPGLHDDTIFQDLKRERQEMLRDDRKWLSDVAEREARLREEHGIATDRLCIPSSDAMSKVQRYLGPLEKRYLKDLEVLLKVQAIRLGIRRLNEN